MVARSIKVSVVTVSFCMAFSEIAGLSSFHSICPFVARARAKVQRVIA